MTIADELKSAIVDHRLETGRYPEVITVTPVKMAELMQRSLEQTRSGDTADPNLFMGVEIKVEAEQTDPIVVQH